MPDPATIGIAAAWLVSLFIAYVAGNVAGERRQRVEDLEERFLNDGGD